MAFSTASAASSGDTPAFTKSGICNPDLGPAAYSRRTCQVRTLRIMNQAAPIDYYSRRAHQYERIDHKPDSTTRIP